MTAIDLDTMPRGACPSLAAPMQTGDGWLSRVALTAPASPAALIGLCKTALRHGNGLIDISARGNLQARGLCEASTRLFEADIRALNLPLREGVAVDISPLAGLDPTETADPSPLAQAIRAGVAEMGLQPHLAPKTAVIVDGGGSIPLAALLADIRLKAHGTNWLLFTGGAENPPAAHGLLTAQEAVPAALTLLARMAQEGRRFRGRDFTATDVRTLLPALRPAPPLPACEATEPKPLGLFALRGGLFALGLAPAFGQVEAISLIALLETAQAKGITAISPAPGHALLAFGPAAACHALKSHAEQAGFITGPDDPCLSIAACPGQPACTSAHFDTRALARAIASKGGLLDGSFTLHISGCAKGCAHPESALLSLSGTPDGPAFVFDGKASDPPNARLAANRAPEALERLSALVKLRQRPGESAALCLRRLGPSEIISFLDKGFP